MKGWSNLGHEATIGHVFGGEVPGSGWRVEGLGWGGGGTSATQSSKTVSKYSSVTLNFIDVRTADMVSI